MKKKLKNLKYNLRASIIRFLLRCCKFLRGHCYCKNEFYYETIKIKIKELLHSHTSRQEFKTFSMKELIEKNIWPPNKMQTWRELIEDIKINGIKVKPTVIKNEYEYEIYDGNHRIKILKYLYGGEHETMVDVYLKNKKYIPYYATMGIIDEMEYKKIILKQRLVHTKNKIYEA